MNRSLWRRKSSGGPLDTQQSREYSPHPPPKFWRKHTHLDWWKDDAERLFAARCCSGNGLRCEWTRAGHLGTRIYGEVSRFSAGALRQQLGLGLGSASARGLHSRKSSGNRAESGPLWPGAVSTPAVGHDPGDMDGGAASPATGSTAQRTASQLTAAQLTTSQRTTAQRTQAHPTTAQRHNTTRHDQLKHQRRTP